MDTKYFLMALDEYLEDWKKNNPSAPLPRVGDLPLTTLSLLLKRAQQFKDDDPYYSAAEASRDDRS